MGEANKKLFLLDAFALIYRAYYALGENFLYNSKGFNTTAVAGFTNTIYDLIQKEKPTHMAVAFDTMQPTERASEFDFYKANREAMPEDIKASLPFIREIIDGFNIPLIEKDGYEADDIVGTLAKRAEQDGCEVYMVTPDKDYGQLVSENIFMYKPPYRGRPHEVMGVQEILEKWDIERVDQVIDILGLMGDAVDNIPGIKGVGEKTAIKLLKQFDNIENLLANTDQLKGKLKEKVENDAEKAIVSKLLATIIIDVPVEYDLDSYKIEGFNTEKLTQLFTDLEFRTIGKRILGEDFNVNLAAGADKPKGEAPTNQLDLFAPPANEAHSKLLEDNETLQGKSLENTEHNYTLLNSNEEHQELLDRLLKQKVVCFDTETTGIDPNEAELVGIAFSFKGTEAYYIPVPEDQREAKEVVHRFKPFFESEEIIKVGQNIKYDIIMLKWYDIHVQGPIEDTMLAHYLIEPDMRHNMNILAETYLNYTPVSIENLIGKKGKNQKSMRDVPVEEVTEYAGEDADITLQLYQKFDPVVRESEFDKLYRDVEVPLVPILADMEYQGVRLDKDFLTDYSQELSNDLLDIRQKVFDLAGVEFNLDSPRQLGDVLFNQMEIPYKGKKTKTGQFSTNEDTLSKLVNDHPIAAHVLNYRELNKLRSTYVDALPLMVNPKTDRIHTTFNQTVAATGRLSSINPNLQNIPIRTERGRKVRQAFIPRDEEHILLAADYSQVELRIMAELSGDEALKAAFIGGEDIHSTTAAKVYGVNTTDVTSEMRRSAKMVNFGIIYGITAFGLSQRLGIKRGEAKELIDGYFEQYPKVKEYMDNAVEVAKKRGYAETILGRRRYLKDINSRNHTVRSFAERNAINSPIQGSAADLIKVAMVKVHKEMKRRELQSKMILQVHDELLFDAYMPELEELEALVKENMESAIETEVPIVTEAGTGLNWLEAH